VTIAPEVKAIAVWENVLNMCGIFGAINTKGFFERAEFSRFRDLTDLTSYRGPDDSGYEAFSIKRPPTDDWFDVFLGSRRLSILDLSSKGHQPMTDDQGHWIAYNGEIFNYVELRRELESKGHIFSTGTDTEVILHTYREYGEQGFDRLNGMWSLAILDLPRRRVVLSRDRFSIKPLYTLQLAGKIFFASEIKQLLPLAPTRNMNVEVMSAFLAQGLLDHSPQTFFEGIVATRPRTNIVVSFESGELREHTYWEFDRQPSTSSPEKATAEFRSIFLDSIRLRLRSDVKVGVLLSGGLDSSSIALGCANIVGNGLRTYSVVSEDGRCDESKFIDELGNAGVNNQKITFRPNDVLEDLDHVLYHNDGPVTGFSAIAQYKLFRRIRQDTDVTVLLSGQGGDEVLLGYLKFFFFHLKSLYRERRYWQAVAQLAASFWYRTVITQFTLRSARRYVDRFALRQWRALGVKHTPVPIWSFKDMYTRQVADIEKYSVPVLAHYEDRNSMAHSLEVRHPFLDHRLVSFTMNLPVELKIRHGWTKWVLRQAMPELPSAIRWRRDKQGFLTPEEHWLKNDLRAHIHSMFRNSRLSQAGILNDREFLNYYERFQNGSDVPRGDISRTVIAERWMQQAF